MLAVLCTFCHRVSISSGMGSGRPSLTFKVQPTGVLPSLRVVVRLCLVTMALTLSIWARRNDVARELSKALASSSGEATPFEYEDPCGPLALLLEGWGVAASNLRGGNLSSSKERRRLLPASLGEAATSVVIMTYFPNLCWGKLQPLLVCCD